MEHTMKFWKYNTKINNIFKKNSLETWYFLSIKYIILNCVKLLLSRFILCIF